jgi:hypothetical protein
MSLLLQLSVKGKLLSRGTGFVIQSACGPVLITNRHNLTGRNQETGQPISPTGGIPDTVTIAHNEENKLGHWVLVQEQLYEGQLPRWKEHPTLGARADVVALPLTHLDNVALYPYDAANPGPDLIAGPADPVSVVGFPFGLTGGGGLALWATGFIASEPDVDYADLPCFLIDCRSREGQSGSPVIAYRSGGAVPLKEGVSRFMGTVFRLLGIYSGRINPQSDLGIVWKVRAIQELVASL